MNDRKDDRPQEALPRAWLPEPRPGEGDAYWDGYAARVMSELEPLMAAGDAGARDRRRSWVSEMGDRWQAAALLAAAAVAALLAVAPRDRAVEPVPAPEDLALALVAAEGDPAALWERLGIPADPVLAWLTFDGARP